MKQRVIEQMRSPFQRGQSVLTLACGHLFSWQDQPVPEEIDCPHCGVPSVFLDTEEMKAMDLAVRNLRRGRHGLPPLTE